MIEKQAEIERLRKAIEEKDRLIAEMEEERSRLNGALDKSAEEIKRYMVREHGRHNALQEALLYYQSKLSSLSESGLSGFWAESIPFLTKVYQASPDRYRELLLCANITDPEEILASPLHRETLDATCSMVCSIMESVLLCQEIRYGEIAAVNKLSGMAFFSKELTLNEDYIYPESDTRVPITHLQNKKGKSGSFQYFLVGVGIDLRNLLLNQSHLLFRCDECRSVAIRDPRKEDQRYCSHRCAHRAGERRRRRVSMRNTDMTLT